MCACMYVYTYICLQITKIILYLMLLTLICVIHTFASNSNSEMNSTADRHSWLFLGQRPRNMHNANLPQVMSLESRVCTPGWVMCAPGYWGVCVGVCAGDRAGEPYGDLCGVVARTNPESLITTLASIINDNTGDTLSPYITYSAATL